MTTNNQTTPAKTLISSRQVCVTFVLRAKAAASSMAPIHQTVTLLTGGCRKQAAMIEILNSRRMTIVIVTLILFCTIVVIIEEWLTASGGADLSSSSSSSPPTSQQQPKQEQTSIIDKMPSQYFVTDWRSFLTFLGSAGFFGGLSGLVVKYRQQQLRQKSLSRFR